MLHSSLLTLFNLVKVKTFKPKKMANIGPIIIFVIVVAHFLVGIGYLMYKLLPKKEDKKLIQERITEKINLKPNYYRYYGEHKPKKFFIDLIK